MGRNDKGTLRNPRHHQHVRIRTAPQKQTSMLLQLPLPTLLLLPRSSPNREAAVVTFALFSLLFSFSSLLLFFLNAFRGGWLPFHTQTQVCAVHLTVNLAEWCMPGNAMVRTDARPDTYEGKMCRSLEGGRACVYVTKRSLLQSLFFRATVNLMDCSGMSLFFRTFETEYRPRMCVFSVVDVIKWPKGGDRTAKPTRTFKWFYECEFYSFFSSFLPSFLTSS